MNKQPIIELSEDLRNKISAGEVVERPSSVVKELVENSLDANATKIKVELIDGGLKKIIVTDNGYGMTQDEIPVALRRHATSKIKTSDDLFYITSLGFRGEALPSISSVSKFTITSSTNSLDGYYYYYEGGKLIEKNPSPMNVGTKIEVADLFYNTPARFKHLSSIPQELSHITAFINRMALARSDVSFTLVNNGKTLLQTNGDGNLESIINETYGNVVAKNLVHFSNKNELYAIEGMTTNNTINRSNRNSINLIVNGRIIRNMSLVYAITDAYKTILPIGKYPVTVLSISCDPSLVDVNVHPSKLEIRFTDEASLKSLITRTIYANLIKKEMIINELETNDDKAPQNVTQITAFETKKVDEIPTESLWEMFDEAKPTTENEEEPGETTIDIIKEEPKVTYREVPIFKENDKIFFQNFTYIGQYAKTYLLMEYQKDLYLIDQHAAMERFMYEKISKELSTPSNNTYELLVPIKLEYNISTIPLILEKKDEITRLGIELEEFGPTTIIVRVVPVWIPKDYCVEFIRDIINHIITNRNVNKGVMFDSLAKTLSCKKSIKGNMSITELEVQALMKKLDECNFPYTCPHGRPTIIKFTEYEIEKMFKRVM